MSWGEMIRLAVRFGVTPERFWRLSLREWRWLTATGEAEAMTRVEMERLVARWPDGARAVQAEPSRAPSTATRSPSPASGGGST